MPESENLSYFQRPDWFAFSSRSVMPCQRFVKQYKSDSNESFEKHVSVALGRVRIQTQNSLLPNLLRCWEKETVQDTQSSKLFIWCLDKAFRHYMEVQHTHTHRPLFRVACCHSMRAMSEVHACLMSAVAAWRMYVWFFEVLLRNQISKRSPFSPVVSVIPTSAVYKITKTDYCT